MTDKLTPPRTDEPEEIRKYREQASFHLNDIDGRLVTAEADIVTAEADIDALEAQVATAQSDSTATTVSAIVTDFNSLLAKLRTAGLMAT